MPVRTTVDIPEPLHERLRRRAESSGASIRSLIVRAIEETYAEPKKGKRGPLYPVDENPHDLVLY
jgi:metal-responsive CopG/Arc/MetJ family transcriptional regulator